MSLPVNRDEDVKDEDSAVVRNRNARTGVFWAIASPRIIAPTFLATVIFQIIGAACNFDAPLWVGIAIGLVISAVQVAKMLRQYTVNVPLKGGHVTTSPSGKLNVYGAGIHARFPGEDVIEAGHFSLVVIQAKFDSETVASRDAQLIVSGMVTFQPALRRLDKYAGVNEEAVSTAFQKQVQAMLSADVARLTADQARAFMPFLTQRLRIAFDLPMLVLPRTAAKDDFERIFGPLIAAPRNLAAKRAELEERLGGILLDIIINDMDFSPEYQAVLDKEAESKRVPHMVARLFAIHLVNDDGTPNQAGIDELKEITKKPDYLNYLDRALALMDKVEIKSTRETKKYEFEGSRELAEAAIRWLQSQSKKP